MTNLMTVAKKTNIKAWACAVLLFITAYPMWLWNISSQIITISSFLLFLFAITKMDNKPNVFCIVAYCLQIVILFVQNTTTVINLFGILFMFVQFVCFIPLFFGRADFWREIFDCFIKIVGVLLLFALIEHLVGVFGGFYLISHSYKECPTNPGRIYHCYLFNAYLEESYKFIGSSFNRFYGFFNEPGELGTFMIALLFSQRFDLKKWYNVVFLISGLFSFSIVFYIIIVVWYIVFGNMKVKIIFSILGIGFFYYFYNNEYLYEYIFGRLEFENGHMLGYNRENEYFKYWLKNISINDYLFTPYYDRSAIVFSTSWKWAFVYWGIIPCIVYLLSLVLSRVRKIKTYKDILLCGVVVLAYFIQRPFLHSYIYVCMMLLPSYYFSSSLKLDNFELIDNNQ